MRTRRHNRFEALLLEDRHLALAVLVEILRYFSNVVVELIPRVRIRATSERFCPPCGQAVLGRWPLREAAGSKRRFQSELDAPLFLKR